MINKTGVVIAIYRDDKFESLEPDGKAAVLIEMRSDSYNIDGVSFRDVEISGVRNLPDKTDDLIIVNREVAIFGWSIGRTDLIYLDGCLCYYLLCLLFSSCCSIKFSSTPLFTVSIINPKDWLLF